MITAIAIASISSFIVGFWVLGVARVGADALTTAQGAISFMRDKSLADETREKAVQRSSLQLIKAFASILIRSALALAAAFLPVWLAGLIDLVTIEEVVRYLSRWDVIVVATVVTVIGYLIWTRLWPSR